MGNNRVEFSLVPFNISNRDRLKVSGNVSIINSELTIEYYLQGDLSTVIIPESNSISERQIGLWEHTCFEFFIKPQDSIEYWEFNLSSSKNWNVFHLTNYRKNLTEDNNFNSLYFDVSNTNEALNINLTLDINKIMSCDRGINIAIATVIETKDNGLSYWSLIHPETEADFHHPDSFIINI